jgi:hypothetical protein
MSAPTTAPLLAALKGAEQARAATPTNRVLSKEPFTLDMPAVHAWLAEQAGKVGTPLTPKEMAKWDVRTRRAWSGLL